ncbi:MAG: hypothetical protein HQ532_00190 [Candidatus Omnitrophica bacterium]|nr:hypothetical protein [Candidatus Omnitrophota bacterium]
MTKNVFFIAILLILFSAGKIFSVPAAPSSTFNIVAKVVNIEKKILKANPGLGSYKDREYYDVELEALESKLLTDEGRGEIEVGKATLKMTGEPEADIVFKVGQRISAIAGFTGDERLGGNFIWDVKVLDEKDESKNSE